MEAAIDTACDNDHVHHAGATRRTRAAHIFITQARKEKHGEKEASVRARGRANDRVQVAARIHVKCTQHAHAGHLLSSCGHSNENARPQTALKARFPCAFRLRHCETSTRVAANDPVSRLAGGTSEKIERTRETFSSHDFDRFSFSLSFFLVDRIASVLESHAPLPTGLQCNRLLRVRERMRIRNASGMSGRYPHKIFFSKLFSTIIEI